MKKTCLAFQDCLKTFTHDQDKAIRPEATLEKFYSKIESLDFDKYSDRKLLCFLSASRILLSMISAIIALILIKSNLVLGLVDNVDGAYPYYCIAVLAGFSENYIPDLLKKINNDNRT